MIKWKLLAAAAACCAWPLSASSEIAQPPSAQPPTGTPVRQIAGSISHADYPAAAIAARQQGTSGIRFTVGTDGRVTNCQVERSSGSQALDAAACALVTERFLFQPARNAAGQAVATSTSRRITWRLPEDGRAFADYTLVISARLNGARIESCTFSEGGLQPEPGPYGIEACTAVFSPLLSWAAARGGVTSITQVVAFTPSGSSPPVIRPEWGNVVLRAEASVGIGQDGNPTRCLLARMERAPDAGALGPVDPCGFNASNPFDPTTSPEPREGTSMIATYAVRTQPVG